MSSTPSPSGCPCRPRCPTKCASSWRCIPSRETGDPRSSTSPRPTTPGRALVPTARAPLGRGGPEMATVAELIESAIRLAHDCDHERAVRELIEQAGDRNCLEEVNDILIARVHKRPTDLDASRALN